MPEIGASLREARMRARIDITEAEADTKIRGKYLRALENEEWRLLPGPTFVRSFLRTYGDYLGLDGRLLVEEFKLRHEQAEGEPRPIAAAGHRTERRRTRGPSNAARTRALIAGAVLIALLAGLFALGRGSDDNSADSKTGTTTSAPAAGVATLRIEPTKAVYACIRAADGRPLADGVLQPGGASKEYRSRRLRLTLGSGSARLIVNGRPKSLPASSRPLGYEITRDGAKRIGAQDRPRCS